MLLGCRLQHVGSWYRRSTRAVWAAQRHTHGQPQVHRQVPTESVWQLHPHGQVGRSTYQRKSFQHRRPVDRPASHVGCDMDICHGSELTCHTGDMFSSDMYKCLCRRARRQTTFSSVSLHDDLMSAYISRHADCCHTEGVTSSCINKLASKIQYYT